MLRTRFSPARVTRNLCTIALVSVGAGGCMMGGMGTRMSPEMMQAHSAMHAFTMATHMGEIEEAQLATSKTSNAAVRDYAQRMITEHTAAMQREQQMMASMGMTMGMDGQMQMGQGGSSAGMSGNAGGGAGMNMDMSRMRAMLMEHPHSRPVMEGHMQAMQMLQGLHGMQFDQAYMQRQVNAHRYTLENMDRMMSHMGMAADGSMMGGSGNAAGGNMQGGAHAGMQHGGMAGGQDMMGMYRTERAMIASHLEMAQQMMGSMRSR